MLTIPYAHAHTSAHTIAPLLHPDPSALAYSQCSRPGHVHASADAHEL